MKNYAKVLMTNRGFAGEKINTKVMDVEDVRVWHEALDKLHSVAYQVASERYNQVGDNNGSLVSRFYSVLRGVYDLIGELDNGAKLRADANACNTLVAMATRMGVKKDKDVTFLESKKRNASKYLKDLEASNGSNEDAKKLCRQEIEECDAKLEALKKESMKVYKEMVKCGSATFYKSFED